MDQRPDEADEIIEREIRAVLAEIDVHLSAVEVLLSKFHDETGDDDDGGAGLAHLEVLSLVFDDIVTDNLQPGWADHRIWSEKERDRWSPFATEVSDHLYATWPLVVKLVDLRQQMTKPCGLASIALLRWRVEAAGEHRPPPQLRTNQCQPALPAHRTNSRTEKGSRRRSSVLAER